MVNQAAAPRSRRRTKATRSRVPASVVPPARLAPAAQPQGVSLYEETGARRYLADSERSAFLAAAERADRQVRALCTTLAFAGYRLSEALALTGDRAELADRLIFFETLKKPHAVVYRAVPVPLHCSTRSISSTGSANSSPAETRDTVAASGPGRR